MILNEAHLRRLLRAYLAYYNTVRPDRAVALQAVVGRHQ